MASQEQAVARLQAHFRGSRWRRRWRRGLAALTRLQARQRGRFTRREFVQLRAFSREQENFQQATRRRQLRIWRNEQELYFLQHTNAADLERVRDFQQQHAARLIQRAWRGVADAAASLATTKALLVHPRDRIYTFDPFRVASDAESAARFDHWHRVGQDHGRISSSQSLFLGVGGSNAPSGEQQRPAVPVDDETLAWKRKAVHERIKRRVAQQKAEVAAQAKPRASSIRDALGGAKPSTNQRRELYEQLVALQCVTARRVLAYEREYRATRADRERTTAQLVLSCENRLRHLQAESPEQMEACLDDTEQTTVRVDGDMEHWDDARKTCAWSHHRRAVNSALERRHWWQTQLAGQQRDIRRVMLLRSPWEDEGKVWSWPRKVENDTSLEQKDGDGTGTTALEAPSPEIERFLCSDKGSTDAARQAEGGDRPVQDHEASEWWLAHCMQPHLAINKLPQEPSSSHSVCSYGGGGSRNVEVNGFPVCTPEAMANRELYELQKRAKRVARSKSVALDVESRAKVLETKIQRRVHEMEEQLEANTQLALELVKRKQQRRARISREQQAATTIQRHTRGMQGRRRARERWAEFFVLVRGRAIRRGRCEECGDERAVLECQQCEESVHFCPLCWVHVHSTRRRKPHVAIPMSTVEDPVLASEPQMTKDDAVGGLSGVGLMTTGFELSNATAKAVDVAGSVGQVLRLQPLPAPAKDNTTRSAETVTTDQVGSGCEDVVDQVAEAVEINKANLEELGLEPLASNVDCGESELAEACELARRVRMEVAGADVEAEGATGGPDADIDSNGDLPHADSATAMSVLGMEYAATAPLGASIETADAPAQPTEVAIALEPTLPVVQESGVLADVVSTSGENVAQDRPQEQEQEQEQDAEVGTAGAGGNKLEATLAEFPSLNDSIATPNLGDELLPQDHEALATTIDDGTNTGKDKQLTETTIEGDGAAEDDGVTSDQCASSAVESTEANANTTIVSCSSAAAVPTSAAGGVDATGGSTCTQAGMLATETGDLLGAEVTTASASQDDMPNDLKPVEDENHAVAASDSHGDNEDVTASNLGAT